MYRFGGTSFTSAGYGVLPALPPTPGIERSAAARRQRRLRRAAAADDRSGRKHAGRHRAAATSPAASGGRARVREIAIDRRQTPAR